MGGFPQLPVHLLCSIALICPFRKHWKGRQTLEVVSGALSEPIAPNPFTLPLPKSFHLCPGAWCWMEVGTHGVTPNSFTYGIPKSFHLCLQAWICAGVPARMRPKSFHLSSPQIRSPSGSNLRSRVSHLGCTLGWLSPNLFTLAIPKSFHL